MSPATDPAPDSTQEGPAAGPAGSIPLDVPPFIDLDACGIALASVSADGRPIVGKGAGHVLQDGTLRISARKPANEDLIDAVLRGAPIAATFSRPTTHGSVQFKGRAPRLDDPGHQDYVAALRQRERFSAELLACAYTPDFVEKYTAFAPHELVVLAFTPDETFDQTPGPAAGARLR